MNSHQLGMLLAVIESGGYTQAGRRLHVSHSAIHRQVRLLEREVNDRILVRVGRRVEPTEAGRILVALAERVRGDFANALVDIRNLTQGVSGHLRLGSGTTMLRYFLPRVLERLHRERPKISTHMVSGAGEQLLRDICTGRLDVALAYSPNVSSQASRVAWEVLYKDELVLAVGREHWLGSRRVVSPSDLLDMPFITYTKASHVRQLIDGRLRQVGVEPHIIMELENEEAIEEMVGANIGVGLLSKPRVLEKGIRHFHIKGVRLIVEACLVYPKLQYVPHVVREFARICREESCNRSVPH